jgi:hypothetical protein
MAQGDGVASWRVGVRWLHRTTFAAAVGAVACLGGVAEAAEITECVPRDVGVSDVFEIRGSGLASPDGVSARLQWTTPLREEWQSLVILEVHDDRILASLGRPPRSFARRFAWRSTPPRIVVYFAGEYGAESSNGVISVHGPEPSSDLPVTASAGDVAEVSGRYFGPIKGTLWVGGRRVRTLSWTSDRVEFKVPRKLRPGLYGVEMKNRVGGGQAVGVLTVTGGDERAARRDVFELRKRRRRSRFKVTEARHESAAGELVLSARRRSRACPLGFCGLPLRVETVYDIRIPFVVDPNADPTVLRSSDTGVASDAVRYTNSIHLGNSQVEKKSGPVEEWAVRIASDADGRVFGTLSAVDRGDLIQIRFSARLP